MMQLELPTRSPSPFQGNDKDEKPSSSFSSVPSLTVEETRPSLRRALPSVDGGCGSSSQTRRVSSEPSVSSLSSRLSRSESFGRDVGHAAAETYLVTRLAITLLRYLGVGHRWITKFLALIWYATLLMRGFFRDLYLPAKTDGLRPVLAFVTGGAWIIGYKAWGALLGRRLAERGITVLCVDYRSFFQGIISSMVEDVSQNISFMCNNAEAYGSDPNRTYLIGQSAGAQIGSCTILNQAIKECGGESTSWSVSQIKAYFGISGGWATGGSQSCWHLFVIQLFLCLVFSKVRRSIIYGDKPRNRHVVSLDLITFRLDLYLPAKPDGLRLVVAFVIGGAWVIGLGCTFGERLAERGIIVACIDYSIMEGEQSLRKISPEILVNDSRVKYAICLMPPTILFHGTYDYSIPSLSSEKFANALHNAGAKVKLVLYDGKAHTDLFLQDPLRGGRDKLLQEIISVIYAGDEVKLSDDAETMLSRRLVPEFTKLAGRISPF